MTAPIRSFGYSPTCPAKFPADAGAFGGLTVTKMAKQLLSPKNSNQANLLYLVQGKLRRPGVQCMFTVVFRPLPKTAENAIRVDY